MNNSRTCMLIICPSCCPYDLQSSDTFSILQSGQYFHSVSKNKVEQTAACMIIVHLQGFEQIFDLEKGSIFIM